MSDAQSQSRSLEQEEHAEEDVTFNELNDDVMAYMLNWLPASLVRSICPSSRRAVNDSISYLRVTRQSNLDEFVQFVIHYVTEKHTPIGLDLSGAKKIEDRHVVALAPHLARLQELDLSNSPRLTDSCLNTVAFHIPHLHSLSLFNNSQFSPSALHLLSDSLQRLNVSFCSDSLYQDLPALLPKFTRLHSLLLRGWTPIGTNRLEPEQWHSSLLAQSLPPSLTELDISESNWTHTPAPSQPKRSAAKLQMFPYLSNRLHSLALADSFLHNSNATAFVQHMCSLTKLDVSSNHELDSRFLSPLCPFLTQLTELNVAHTMVTNAAVQQLSQQSFQLVRLDITATKVTDASLEYLQQMSKLRQLEHGGLLSDAVLLQLPHINLPEPPKSRIRWNGQEVREYVPMLPLHECYRQ